MLFNSFPFLFLFLPVVLAVAHRLRGKALIRWITLASFFFYARVGHAWFLAPMLFTTALDFFLAGKLAATKVARRRKRILLLSLGCNLGLLALFKYSRFFLPAGSGGLLNLGLPAGISFYTFQTVSYMIDVYRGEARPEKDFWRFAGFVSFFPHLVAGPLTRHHQLIPSLARIESKGIRPRWSAGTFLFAVGLCKKVLIADRIAAWIDPALVNVSALSPSDAWLCLAGYTLQIYFDFSGYSDMAIGIGRLFGIELPLNFDSPYQSRNPSEFWRRWHITLSNWLRDYLYIPLGGSRCSPGRHRFNLLATMTLGGLWHGANWTFAIWGLYHGMLLIAYDLLRRPWDRLPRWLQNGATLLVVSIGWVFFRAPTFADARLWLLALSGNPATAAGKSFNGADDVSLLTSLVLLGFGIALLARNAASDDGLEKLPSGAQAALGLAVVAAFLFMNLSSKFLYFQF